MILIYRIEYDHTRYLIVFLDYNIKEIDNKYEEMNKYEEILSKQTLFPEKDNH